MSLDMSFHPLNSTHNSSNSASPPPPPSPPPQSSSLEPQYSHPPFDSSMALTILVLLTALFFMGFFSIYLRKFSTDPTPDLSSHRGNHPRIPSRAVSRSAKGLDPQVIRSLPVYAYYHGEARYQLDCAICLGEFEEKETVKVIPHCKHVFHQDCIDMWLKMHVTCPVCRGDRFFDVPV